MQVALIQGLFANDRNPIIDVDERKINAKFMIENCLLLFFDFLDQKTNFLDFLSLKASLNLLKILKNCFLYFKLIKITIFLALNFIIKNCPMRSQHALLL